MVLNYSITKSKNLKGAGFMKSFFVFFLLLLPLSGITLADQTEIEYYAVMIDGKKVGHAIGTRTVEADRVTTTEQMKMTIARAGVLMVIGTTETSVETIDGKPISFESIMDVSNMIQKVTGKINADGKFDVITSAMGMAQQQTIDFPENALMAEGLRLLQLEKGLKNDTVIKAILFSPALLAPVQVEAHVGQTENVDLLGRITPLTKVSISMQTPTGVINSISFVDDQLNAKKIIVPMLGMNLEMIACDKIFALSDNDVVDFLDKLLLQSPIALTDIDSKKSATYLLAVTSTDNRKLQIPSTDSQTVQQPKNGNNNLIVTVTPAIAPAGVKFPYKGDDPKLLEALKPTRFLQSDNKQIKDLAKHAVSDSKHAAEAVKRIESFVAGYITEKNLSVGYASAAEVARSRQGDCSEHAVLTAAICRAAGIPARIVCGFVYIKEFAGKKDVFGPHAWAQAYVGDKWIGIDATKAPHGFGPGHIALAIGNGESSDFLSMVSTAGYFKIEKVDLKN